MEEKEKEKIEENVLDIEVSEVFVVQNSKKRSYIEQFKQKGINFTQKKLGTFLGFFIVRDSSSSSANIVNFLTAEIKKEYFAFPKRGIAESFETSLHRVNRALAEVANVGNVDWLGTIDGAVCAIDEKTMYFSVTGEAVVLLLRNEHLMNISDGLTSEDAKKHPLKTFVDISSGQLMTGDKIIITSPELIKLISFDELKRNALRLSKSNFVQFINTVFTNECKMATAFIIDVNKKVNFSGQNLENDIYDEDDDKIHIPNNVFNAQVFQTNKEEKSEISTNNFDGNVDDLIRKDSEFDAEREAEINGEYTDKRTGHIYLQGENVENVSETWSSITDILKDTTRDIKEGTRKKFRKLAKKLNKNSDFDEDNYQKNVLEVENEIEQLKQEVNFKEKDENVHPIKIKVVQNSEEQDFYEKDKKTENEDFSVKNKFSDFDDEVYFREDLDLLQNNFEDSQNLNLSDSQNLEISQNEEFFQKNEESSNISRRNGIRSIKVREEKDSELLENSVLDSEKLDDSNNFEFKDEFKRGSVNNFYQSNFSKNNKKDLRSEFRKNQKFGFKNETKGDLNFLRENDFEEDLENDFRKELLKNGGFDSINKEKKGFFRNMLTAVLMFFAKIFQFIFFVLDEILFVFQKMNKKSKLLTLLVIVAFLAVPFIFFYRKEKSQVNSLPINTTNQQQNSNNPIPQTPVVPVTNAPATQQSPQINSNINEPEKIYEDKDFIQIGNFEKNDILVTKTELVFLNNKSKFSLPVDSGNIKYFTILDDVKSVYLITDKNKFFSFNLNSKKFEEKKLGDNKDIKNIKLMNVFGKYLYTLSDDGIIKYTQNESGFANGTKWLKETYSTKSVSDITINGSIYLVKGGKVEALFSGKKSDFKLENNVKGDLVFAKDTKFLWVLNKKEATIYKFDLETGKVLDDKFIHNDIKEAIDFIVDETSKNALIVTSNKVLKFKLEKK